MLDTVSSPHPAPSRRGWMLLRLPEVDLSAKFAPVWRPALPSLDKERRREATVWGERSERRG